MRSKYGQNMTGTSRLCEGLIRRVVCWNTAKIFEVKHKEDFINRCDIAVTIGVTVIAKADGQAVLNAACVVKRNWWVWKFARVIGQVIHLLNLNFPVIA